MKLRTVTALKAVKSCIKVVKLLVDGEGSPMGY